MANKLGINLKEGQRVVMEGDNMTEEQRTVVVTGGYGMYTSTSGSALFVRFPNGSTGRMSGHEIEKALDMPTIEVLGEIDDELKKLELRCQVCDEGDNDVSVSVRTGLCSACGVLHNIVGKQIKVEG